MKMPLILNIILTIGLAIGLSIFTSPSANADKVLDSIRNKGVTGTAKMPNPTVPTGAEEWRRPVLKNNVMNGLPGIDFNGGKYFKYDGTLLQNTGYSIFVVEKRTSTEPPGPYGSYFFGYETGCCASGVGLRFGYRNGSIVVFQGNSVLNFPIEAFTSATQEPVRLHLLVYDGSSNIKYYRNGAYIGGYSNISPLIDNKLSYIGRENGWRLDGIIGEIVIYRRALPDEEIKLVTDYLMTKWRIGSK